MVFWKFVNIENKGFYATPYFMHNLLTHPVELTTVQLVIFYLILPPFHSLEGNSALILGRISLVLSIERYVVITVLIG